MYKGRSQPRRYIRELRTTANEQLELRASLALHLAHTVAVPASFRGRSPSLLTMGVHTRSCRALVLCTLTVLPLSGAVRDGRSRLPIAVAHRGASGDAPENTMAAIRLAHALGAEGYETDLHMTRDGEIVLLHDADIRRTTRGWPEDLPVRDDFTFVDKQETPSSAHARVAA